MIVKTYLVDSVREALTRAKYELGRDAIIISQKEVKVGRWYNPFKKKKIEVTLAIEKDSRKPYKNKKKEDRFQVKKKAGCPEDLIKGNPVFKGASDKVRDQLLGYRKLHLREKEDLSKDEIIDFINIAFKDNCFQKKERLNRINVFVGPTGVGKTTTIAKIAAQQHLIEKKKVGLMTIDTYRIGAVEQIKTYANILGIPCEVVKSPIEIREKLNNLKDCDIVLIDTLGMSQRNKERLKDIKRYLQYIEKKTTYLVLSMSTDRETTRSILDKYKKLEYDALILTKLDEINSFTNIWNIIDMNFYPVQYFCYGQDVPDDIEIATLDNLISYSKEILQDE